jgi:alpha-beta hydrolase superfamily lysophospholipase
MSATRLSADSLANLSAEPVSPAPSTLPDMAAPQPIYFPADDRRLFGWLHSPSGECVSDVGLVICKPFGYEALCAHLSLRAFAAMAAASGVATLNFDYAGTGDSADTDAHADQIEIWCRDIISAIAELRQRSGVRRVCLLGFRLGAMLANLVAHRTTVDALVLVAPIVSGGPYLRELRTTALVSTRRHDTPKTAAPKPQGAGGDDESMEVSGYYLSAATISKLRQIDLAALDAPPVSALLVIDRSGIPAARAWIDSVSGRVPTEYSALPGFVEMMMTPPQFTRIPHRIIESVQGWLQRFATPAARSRPLVNVGAAHTEVAATTFLALPGEPSEPGAAIRERPIRFGPDGILFGIVTEPRAGAIPQRAMILVNAGADSHVCVGGMYVALARSWARRGHVVLRMDFAGLGDSSTRPGRPQNEVYPPAAMDDIRAAIELVRGRYRVRDVAIVGLCSGAYHTLQAGVEHLDVNRIVLMNPELFFWRQGTRLEDIHLAEVVNAGSNYNGRMRSFKHWKKLLTGRADIKRIALLQLHRLLLKWGTHARNLARPLRIRLPNDLGWELEKIAKRGIAIDIIFARGEPGIELLRMQGGSSVRRLGDRCRVHFIDGADHTFSRRASRVKLDQVLSEVL